MNTAKRLKPITLKDVGDPDYPEADRWLELFSIFVHVLESPIASVKYLLA
jgi:hypothetical protein